MDFMNKDTMCYKCGNNVKFMGVDGTESVYPTNGMRSFAAHSVNKIFAVADNGLPPVINIVKYPDLQTVSQLTGKPLNKHIPSLTFFNVPLVPYRLLVSFNVTEC